MTEAVTYQLLPADTFDDSTVEPGAPLPDLLASAERIAWSLAAWRGFDSETQNGLELRQRYFLGVLADLIEEERGELAAMLLSPDRAALVAVLRSVGEVEE